MTPAFHESRKLPSAHQQAWPSGVRRKAGVTSQMQSTTPTGWLPVDGGLTLGEDFVATPAKAAGVAKANDQLKKGDHKQAMETLKLSEINVAFRNGGCPARQDDQWDRHPRRN